MEQLPAPQPGSSWSLVGFLKSPIQWTYGKIVGHFHKRADYDHRYRLEREEPLYRQVWSELFELRRTTHCFIDDGARIDPEPVDVEHRKFIDAFNQCQSTIRRNAPFIHESIYTPAREALRAANHILTCYSRRKRTTEMRRGVSEQLLERLHADWAENEKDIDETLEKLGNSVDVVEAAMRVRVFNRG